MVGPKAITDLKHSLYYPLRTPQTTPPLRLLPCLLSAALETDVLKATEGGQVVYCWSDSQVTLWWLKQRGITWQSGVQRSVKMIRGNVVENK